MQLTQRIQGFTKVGNFIHRHYSKAVQPAEANFHLALTELVKTAGIYNGWFIEEFTNHAIKNLGLFLAENDLRALTKNLPEHIKQQKTVALICAGNIPLVCFHDVLCVLIAGHKVLIKMSSDDNVLLPFFLKLLVHYEPEFEKQINFSDGRLSNFDAIIATGSNNTAGYFDYYFSKYPHIIRKNRSSVAVITGNETKEEIRNLGRDMFYYFGLGCRNVSKLLIPENYKLDTIFEGIVDYGYLINNKKYGNNYEYNRAVYLLGNEPFLDNNFVMLKHSNQIDAPISVINYEKYNSAEELQENLKKNEEKIQCIVGQNYIPFGNSQSPVITDFADGVNTINFLVNL